MNEPVLFKSAWHVYTTDAIYTYTSPPMWAWVAHGPRGSQSGVEREAQHAVHKAMFAAGVLADPGQSS